jgi:uncharacterized protein
MSAHLDTVLTRAPDLWQGIVRGRRFVHNPLGWDALAILSRRGAAILDHADGRTLPEIGHDTGIPVPALATELTVLVRNGFVTGAGLPVPSPPPAEKRLDVWLHVTNDCNLDCPYCYIDKGKGVLDDATADRVIASLVRSAVEEGVSRIHVRFAGGEPMLRFPLLRRFFENAREKLAAVGCRLTGAVLTNGTLVPEEALSFFKESGISLSVSIDGVGPAHDATRPLRGGAGSFDRVNAGVSAMIESGLPPYVLITVSRTNLDAMPELTHWLVQKQLGFRYSLARDLEQGDALLETVGPGKRRAGGVVGLRLVGEEARPVLGGAALARAEEVFGECYSIIERAMPLRASFRTTHRFCDLDIRRPLRRACSAGTSYVAVSDRGTLAPCHAALHHEGNGDVDPARSLRAQGRGSDLSSLLRERVPGATCSSCAFRHSCAGGCPLLLVRRDGHAHGRSPYCELFRFVLPRILRIAALEILLRTETARPLSPGARCLSPS